MKSARVALSPQRLAKLFQEELHILLRRQWTHNADAENLPGQRPETSGDLNASFIDQALANFCFVNTPWNAHGVQGRNAVSLGNVHPQAHGLDALNKRLMATTVALPSVLNS